MKNLVFGKQLIKKFCKIQNPKIVVVGGGDGGSGFQACMPQGSNITIIDPKKTYHYQSGYTMVGGGLKNPDELKTSLQDRIKNAQVVRDKVVDIKPDKNQLKTESGQEYQYDVLVLATGTNPIRDSIKGLQSSLEDKNCPVASNYFLDTAEKMNNLRQQFKGGNFVFTQPSTPIKCGGAPQKILYLSAYYWQQKNLNVHLDFYTGSPSIFPMKFYGDALEKIADSYKVQKHYKMELIEIKGKERIAIFKNLDNGEVVNKEFDGLHVTPHMRPLELYKQAKLSNDNGYVNVDHKTLQHNKFKNIFAVGDCADLPTSKTLSAVNEQIHILSKNIQSYVKGEELKEKYNGYTACPVFVGNDKVMLCEFGYDQTPLPTFEKDQRTPRNIYYFLKSHVFSTLALQGQCHNVRFMRGLSKKLFKQ